MSQEIILFNSKQIRRHWDKKKENRYFSVVDVVGILSQSIDGRKYWNKLKQRLKEEGSEVVTICHQLKMKAVDGKMRMTDIADTETMLRIIQSIPSPNAEPLKRRLAKVGYQRIQELNDPEVAIKRALETYLSKGYPVYLMEHTGGHYVFQSSERSFVEKVKITFDISETEVKGTMENITSIGYFVKGSFTGKPISIEEYAEGTK